MIKSRPIPSVLLVLIALASTACSSSGCSSTALSNKEFASTAPVLQPPPSIRKIYNASIVMVDQDKDSIAAGTILRYRKGEKLQVLSACHVACTINEVWYAKLVNGTLVPVKVVKGDKVSDLSLLESIEPMKWSGDEVELSDRDPFIGEEIVVIGTPAGDERTVSIGHIGNILKTSKNLYRYRVDASTYYGNSGGGVFTRENKLIGVLIAGKLHMVTIATIPVPSGFIPGAGIATTIQDIRKLLTN